MGTIFLARHGRTTLNADGRLRGRLDPPLDEVGEREVVALAKAMAQQRVVQVLAIPLTRAMQTARAIADACSLPVTPLSGLLDRDYGQWAGDREEEVVARFGGLDAAPGVEAVADVVARARAVLEDQRSVLTRGDVVLVAHDAVNRALLHDLDPRIPPQQPQQTACWNEIRPDGQGWQVIAVDQTPSRNAAVDPSANG